MWGWWGLHDHDSGLEQSVFKPHWFACSKP